MSFEWADDLSTGVADIDSQHREIIVRINALLDDCAGGAHREAIGGYLAFLLEYVAYHFAAEEREMVGCGYPGLAAHEAEHEEFKRRMNDLSRSFHHQGATIPVVLTTIHAAGEWLVNHIMQTDREMAAFLKMQPG